MSKLFLLPLLLSFFVAIAGNGQQADSEDMMDFMPAIIAAAGGSCDPSSLGALRANCTLLVNTDYDLNSRTITLPRGVKFDFTRGSIRNGTLIFNGGTIDGRLLNASLTIRGSVELKDPVFKFTPAKWNVREGRVSKAQAIANRVNINKAMDQIRPLGGHTMELGKMDAFFDVGWRRGNRLEQSRVSIRISSNFHFKMSNQTYLRVFPTDQPAYSLITLYVTENSKVSGGHLAGDRYEHRYVPVEHGAGHEFGAVIYVIGSHNAVIENVDAYHGTGESLLIHAETIRNADGTLAPGTKTTENLLVKGGTFRDSRRNNIAVIDADGVVFDGIKVLRAGQGETLFDADGNKIDSAAGTAPRYGMDLEANRLRNDDGTLNEINRITDITIRNSTFRANNKGEIDVYTASNVLIERNSFDSRVANFASRDVIVQDNVFESSGAIGSAILITPRIGEISGERLTYNWQVLRNTIRGYEVAISVGAERITVSGNKLYENATGIQMQSLTDSTISNNIIESNLPVSYGHSPVVGAVINNVVISGEKINVGHRPLNFRETNASATNTSRTQLTVENSDLKSRSFWPVHLSDSKNILIRDSRYTNDIEVLRSENIVLERNELISQ